MPSRDRKGFIPAWKQRSVDEINRIRSERHGKVSEAYRSSSCCRDYLIVFALAALEISSWRQEEAPPIHSSQLHEIAPDSTALTALVSALSYFSVLFSAQLFCLFFCVPETFPCIRNGPAAACAPHTQQERLRPLLQPELPQLLDVERALFGARRKQWSG